MGNLGKSLLVGGAVLALLAGYKVATFKDPRTAEQKLESGISYFASACSDVTRNRYINGSLGKGPAYCDCILGNVKGVLNTQDEYRYAAKLHSASGKERWFFEETRIEAGIKKVRDEFTSILGSERIADINQSFFPKAKACARAM